MSRQVSSVVGRKTWAPAHSIYTYEGLACFNEPGRVFIVIEQADEVDDEKYCATSSVADILHALKTGMDVEGDSPAQLILKGCYVSM